MFSTLHKAFFVGCVCVLCAHYLPFIQVDIDPNAGIFITLNPAGKGYGGRQKLPDNLKQLFRPVAMSKPDNELIAEVLLFAEGFKQAKTLGRKLVVAFSLSRYYKTKKCIPVYVLQQHPWSRRISQRKMRQSLKLFEVLSCLVSPALICLL